jgi:hypothetical protein
MIKIIYFVLGIFAIMTSWYENHSVLLVILHYIFWPVYLLVELLRGVFANGGGSAIIHYYFS